MNQPVPPNASPVQVAYATPQQRSADVDQLNLLSIFHFIVAGLIMLFGSIPLIHVAIGVMMLRGGFGPGGVGPAGDPGARWIGLIFIAIGGGIVLASWGTGLLTIYSGVQLRQRRQRVFSMVIAGILCAFLPFGTVLGVFTLVVMSRPTVRALYGA